MRALLPMILLAALTAAPAAELPAVKPVRGVIHRWVSLPGSLAPWQQAVLHAKVTGHVRAMKVDRGDAVKAGQVLAELDVPELEADAAKAREVIKAAEIEVKRLHAARVKSPDLVLPQSVDDAEARLSVARVESARVDAMLRFAVITAPFDGIITARHADPGALASAGVTKLLDLADLATLRLRVSVPELEAPLVVPGKPVTARFGAVGVPAVEATVSRIAWSLDPATRTMIMEADVRNPELRLRPGMHAMARVAVERHDDAVLLPVGALVVEKTASFIFRHVDGLAVKTPVKPAFNDGTQVEIPGLAMDAVVLLPGPLPPPDKQAVTIRP